MALVRRKNGFPIVATNKFSGTEVEDVIKANNPYVDFYQTEINTTNAGTTANNQFRQKNANSGSVCDIGWGDGSFNETNGGTTTHTYSTPGAYKVRCIGNQRIESLHEDVAKITQINRFGKFNLVDFGSQAFEGVGITNLLLAIDTPNPVVNNGTSKNRFFYGSDFTNWPATCVWDFEISDGVSFFQYNPNLNGNIGVITGTFSTTKAMLSGCSSFNNGGSADINNLTLSLSGDNSSCFNGCTVFNQPVGNWNMTGATSLASYFRNASAFNQDIGDWNVASVTLLQQMFSGAGAFNNGGVGGVNTGIDKWNTGLNTSLYQTFLSTVGFNQYIGSWNVSNVTSLRQTFNGGGFDNGGIGDLNSWDTQKVTDFRQCFANPVFNKGVGDWVFGLPDSTGNTTSTVVNKLVDSTANFTADGITNSYKVRNETTGSVASVTSIAATELTLDDDIFTSTGNSYSVFKLINMQAMFQYNRDFNQDIGDWNMENVFDMRSFLQEGTAFNNGGVTASGAGMDQWRFKYPIDLSNAFIGSSNFNCAINNWTTNTVTNFSATFRRCGSFNQPINNFDFSECLNAGSMMRQCGSFNQAINGGTGWGTLPKLQSASGIFMQCGSFNQPVTLSCPVSTSFGSMFYECGNLNSAVLIEFPTTVEFNCNQMFRSANNFNQSVDTNGVYWNVEKMTSASLFLSGASYNHSCGNWKLKSATNLTSAFVNTGMSAANVAATIEGWEANIPATGVNATQVFDNESLSESTYPNAKAAYDRLLSAVNVKSSGTNTSIATSKLVDTGADFVTDGVAIGDYVKNTTSEEQALVTAIDSPTQLSLASDIFKGTPATYEVAYGYGWNLTNAINWTT